LQKSAKTVLYFAKVLYFKRVQRRFCILNKCREGSILCNSAEKGLYFVTVREGSVFCKSAEKVLYSATVQRRAYIL
jgi:hypothetical protein